MANVNGKRSHPFPDVTEAANQIKAIQDLCDKDVNVFKNRIKAHCRATQMYRHFR